MAKRTCIATTLLLAALALAESPDWPRFRGPNASGVARDARPPVEFGPSKNVAWKTAVPPGVSSPVLAGDRIYLTAAENEKLVTLAINRFTGEVLWRRTLDKQYDEQKHRLNNSAAPTPVTDGENVYVFFSEFGLVSYGPDGSERWRLPLGPFRNLHGMASSPLLAGDKLILLCDQDLDAHLLAIDKNSGQTLWRADRPEVVHGFSTPTLFDPKDAAPQLIVPGSYQLTSYELETGEKLWWVRGVTWQIKPAAVVGEDTVYMSAWAPGAEAGQRRFFPPFADVAATADANGDGKLSEEEIPEEMRHTGSWRAIDLDADGFMNERDWSFYRARWASRNATIAVKPAGRRGDLTDTAVLWDYEKAVPVVSTPLLYEGALYTIKDGGVLTIFDPATGKVLHQGRLRDAVEKYYASPVAADGRIYFLSEEGKVTVLAATGDRERLALNDLGESCYATPALAGDTLYIRTATTLYAFRSAGS
jgi:outer membrane protein assembly factor BamB